MAFKRLRYFHGQFLKEPDFTDEQKYHMEMLKLHNREVHSPGIVQGLQVIPLAGTNKVNVSKGLAIDAKGREIFLDSDIADFVVPPGSDRIAIALKEDQADMAPESDPIRENTRWGESPVLITLADPNYPDAIVLAQVTGTTPLTLNTSFIPMYSAPIVTGNLEVKKDLTVKGNLTVQGATTVVESQQMRGDVTLGDADEDTVTIKGSLVTGHTTGVLQIGSPVQVSGDLNLAGTLSGALGPNLVGTDQIVDSAVTESKLAVNAVSAGKLRSDATLDANRAVTTDHIRDLAVTESKLANNAVSASKLRADGTLDINRAVTTNHIRDLAITEIKLANNVVSAGKLRSDATVDANRAVTTDHIRDLAITEIKLANNAVSAGKLRSDATVDANRAVTTNHIRDLAITEPKLASGAVSIKKLKTRRVQRLFSSILAANSIDLIVSAVFRDVTTGEVDLVLMYPHTPTENGKFEWKEYSETVNGTPRHHIVATNMAGFQIKLIIDVYEIITT